MKRTLCSLLLLIGLLASLVLPVFAAEQEETASLTQETQQSEATELSQEESAAMELGTEETAIVEESPAAEPSQQTRSPRTYTLSEAGRAFVTEMMGVPGSNALSGAEAAVNEFITKNALDLSQEQFDALVDLCLEYGKGILDYKVGKLIASGEYTDAQLASAFCAWVKSGGSFSQNKLNRRLRQIKLFLYGSYDGVCDARFRYVIYYGNGGNLDDNTVICYPLGETYKELPTASRSGSYFAGWYTAAAGGNHIYNSMTVSENYALYAHWSEEPVDAPNEQGNSGLPADWPALPELKISEAGIQFIKDHEGFLEYPVWDYSQYTVGYGTRYEPSKSPIPISTPITEMEADYLLRYMLADFEEVLEKHLKKGTVVHTQQQYDVLVSLTFNLGSQWLKSNYTIYQYIFYGGYTEMEFVNALGKWCNAGGSVVKGLAKRRMDEAHLYLNGEYTLGSRTYLFIQFNGAKGESEDKYRYYKTGEVLGELPGASREGYRLTGWYSKVSGGTEYTEQTVAPAYGVFTLYARWEEGAPEPTEPDPTETEPTEPDPTETEPTEPDPTETEPTEPETSEPDEGRFSDVSKDVWYYDYVTRAVQGGLFSGVSETEFAPDGKMTRAMLATVLYRIAGQPAVTETTPFTDVPAGQWFSAAIAWAYQNGIVNGVSADRFGVDSYITREQLTVMLLRYAGVCGYDASARTELDAFEDRAEISDFALESLQWAVAEGFVGGDGGRLNPRGNATRAQCAKMLVCFMDLLLAAQMSE